MEIIASALIGLAALFTPTPLVTIEAVPFQRLEASVAPEPVYEATEAILATTTPDEPDEYACNCYLEARRRVGFLPLTKDLHPNSECMPGAVAIFDYDGLPHYAYITEGNADEFTVEESNYRRCKYTTRLISRTDPHIVGCYFPN